MRWGGEVVAVYGDFFAVICVVGHEGLSHGMRGYRMG